MRPPQTEKEDRQHSSLGSLVANPLVLCECPPDASNTGSAAPCEPAGGRDHLVQPRFRATPAGGLAHSPPGASWA